MAQKESKKSSLEREGGRKEEKKRSLYRSKDDKIISGVFGGLAGYLNIDPVILRIIGVVLFLAKPGEFILFYIIASIIIPESDKEISHKETTASKEEKASVDGGFLFGVALVVLGVVFILQKFFSWFTFDYVWPFALIGVGLYILLRR
ncbi:MAG: PspC domain-containing protein [archaeon]|nr:PspC domain-containing protein [archaeon]